MSDNKGLLSSGLGMVGRNKRYILWFWLLNLTLAEFGTSALRRSAHTILDHSLAAERLVHGFDLSVMIGLFARPEFGQMQAMTTPALCFAFVFFMATALFVPGIFQGYASTYRLPRDDFFRACGRNLWRFIRLMIVAGIVMGIAAGVLFALNGALVTKVGESTNELLPFEMRMTGLAVIFLVMMTLRVWFDLAEADIVLSDQQGRAKIHCRGLPLYLSQPGPSACQLRSSHDCGRGRPPWWTLDVDEDCDPGKRMGRVRSQPTHVAFAVDPALLAAWRSGFLLAAADDDSRSRSAADRAAARSDCGCF